jgi:hypothetical protein
MKHGWWFGLVLIGVAGCAAPKAATPAISEADARSIAEKKGTEEKYDMSVFRIVSVERDQEKGEWRVFAEHRPPTPPGGHFIVYVDGTSGAARLVHGE